jgi:hypothetical protein
MLAPAVVELIVTVCAEVYVPATGENVGVATTLCVAVKSTPVMSAPLTVSLALVGEKV